MYLTLSNVSSNQGENCA